MGILFFIISYLGLSLLINSIPLINIAFRMNGSVMRQLGYTLCSLALFVLGGYAFFGSLYLANINDAVSSWFHTFLGWIFLCFIMSIYGAMFCKRHNGELEGWKAEWLDEKVWNNMLVIVTLPFIIIPVYVGDEEEHLSLYRFGDFKKFRKWAKENDRDLSADNFARYLKIYKDK